MIIELLDIEESSKEYSRGNNVLIFIKDPHIRLLPKGRISMTFKGAHVLEVVDKMF